MKRFLLLFCTVVLVCSFMIVPALAAGSIYTDDVDFDGEAINFPVGDIADGSYILRLGHSERFYDLPVELIFLDGGSFRYTDIIVIDHFENLSNISLIFISYPSENYSCLEGSVTGPMADGEIASSGLYGYFESAELIPVESEPVTGGSPLSGIFDVFGGVGSWIVGQLGATTSFFWNGQGLTFLGVLSVCALALAVVLLLVMVVVRFLRFRG